jgi:hypothetical protein
VAHSVSESVILPGYSVNLVLSNIILKFSKSSSDAAASACHAAQAVTLSQCDIAVTLSISSSDLGHLQRTSSAGMTAAVTVTTTLYGNTRRLSDGWSKFQVSNTLQESRLLTLRLFSPPTQRWFHPTSRNTLFCNASMRCCGRCRP